jgi:hypothetical protein
VDARGKEVKGLVGSLEMSLPSVDNPITGLHGMGGEKIGEHGDLPLEYFPIF